MKNMHFILDGKIPVDTEDVIKWATWFTEALADGSRVVKKTELPNGVTLSTIFIGLNYEYRKDHPPILFETMIFGGGNDFQERYATWEEAEKRHDEILKEYFKVDSNVRK